LAAVLLKISIFFPIASPREFRCSLRENLFNFLLTPLKFSGVIPEREGRRKRYEKIDLVGKISVVAVPESAPGEIDGCTDDGYTVARYTIARYAAARYAAARF
jgi:hypothetical protein